MPELSREEMVARLGRESFDVAVIGGGINGAAIAREAALRGLHVALIDQGDFAGATSSRSSKLIHGGLRYLPQGHLGLVRSALRERERLCTLTAPHLVKRMPFLFPVYRSGQPGRLALWTGLKLYDLLAHTRRPERSRRLNAQAVATVEPALERRNLIGGGLYWDASGDDARLTLENLLDAAEHGAAIANYVTLEGFTRSGGRLAAAGVRDLETGIAGEIKARVFVNAAGPWIDDLRRLDDPTVVPSVRLSKGVHLVIAGARLPVSHAVVLAEGERIVFILPHGDWVLVGTTDTDFTGDRANLRVDEDEIGYLLQILRRGFSGLNLTCPDVAAGFAGLRALVIDGGRYRPSAVSREESIMQSRSGLISVAGGKLTTHREIAERVVARLLVMLGRPAGPSPTRTLPLPGARALEPDAIATTPALAEDLRTVLAERYGTRGALVTRLAGRDSALAAPLLGSRVLGAEVVYAVRHELARSVGDFIARRIALTWRDPPAAAAIARPVAALMGRELGWGAERINAEIERFFTTLTWATAAPAQTPGRGDVAAVEIAARSHAPTGSNTG